MPIILLQLYQFPIKLNVILLSSNGPKQVNYSIHSLSAGLSFQRQTLTVPEDHPHPLSVDVSLTVWSRCMQPVSMYGQYEHRHVGTSVVNQCFFSLKHTGLSELKGVQSCVSVGFYLPLNKIKTKPTQTTKE